MALQLHPFHGLPLSFSRTLHELTLQFATQASSKSAIQCSPHSCAVSMRMITTARLCLKCEGRSVSVFASFHRLYAWMTRLKCPLVSLSSICHPVCELVLVSLQEGRQALQALDHDQASRGSLTPSDILHCDIPDLPGGSFYSGVLNVLVKDSVLQLRFGMPWNWPLSCHPLCWRNPSC